MAVSRARLWTGRVISTLVSLMFVMSGAMKLKGGPEVSAGMGHLQIGESMLLPLAILELACVAVYAIPPTAVLGAVLLTGYVGGIILTHWRVADALVVPIVLGLLVWLGIYLREPRLAALLPVRRPEPGPGM